MALKLPDSAVPMGDFPVAKAVDIDFNDGENLQDKFDNGELGGGGGSSEKQIKDWVSEETYEIGDYVYYDGKLYRCTTENSDIGFDETNWERLTYDMSTIIDENSTNDTIPTSKAVYDLIDYVKSLITQQPKALLTYTFSTGHPVLPQLNNDDAYDYTWKDTDNSNGTTTRTLYGSVPVTRVNFSNDANRQYLKSLDNTVNMRLTNMTNMFHGCSGLTSVNLTNIDTTNVIDMTGVFYNCERLASLVVDNFNTINVTAMTNMFHGCSGLISFASNFNTANVTDMSGMFSNCTALTTVNFDIFDTTKVTTMRSMFNNCTELTTLDLSNFNTANVTETRYMFQGCNKLTTLRLDNFSSANISNCSEMFENVPSSCSIYRNSSKFTKTESETGFSGTFKNV